MYNLEQCLAHSKYPTTVSVKKMCDGDFPGGGVVKNLPANAGDMGLSPGPGSSHMPWSN